MIKKEDYVTMQCPKCLKTQIMEKEILVHLGNNIKCSKCRLKFKILKRREVITK